MIKGLLKTRKKRFKLYGVLTLILGLFLGGSYAATVAQIAGNEINGIIDKFIYAVPNFFVNLLPWKFIYELFVSDVARGTFLNGFLVCGFITFAVCLIYEIKYAEYR